MPNPGKCRKCGKPISRDKSKTCYYCRNKEGVEEGDFKPKKEKILKKWRTFNS